MKKNAIKVLAIMFLTIFLISPTTASVLLQQNTENGNLTQITTEIPPLRSGLGEEIVNGGSDIPPILTSSPGVNEKYIPEYYDISKFLMNNEMATYQKVWEPWLTKAAVRVIATDPSNEFLAVGGGYLYDNEIHLYRWNAFTREYDKVWDSGDMIIQGDVLSIAFGDTDNNDFMEIVAGSADGHVYVFEQEHIYDPFDNMENQFVHVWTSPKIQQVWGVQVSDVDKDYLPDIIAGSWDEKIHIYEYTNHSGYPFTKDHWIEYAEKTTIPIGEKIFSLDVGDTDNDNLPEIIAGTQLGRVYIYENNGTILKINGIDWPLTQDNSYRYVWDSGNISWKPILRTIVDNLDDDPNDEIVYLSAGQNVFVVNFDENVGTEGRYLTHQLWFPLESWELGGFEGLGHYLNHYIDWMTWSNNNLSTGTGTYKSYNTTHWQKMNVFVNGSIKPSGVYISNTEFSELHVYWIGTDTFITEPYDRYVWEPQWPKNTSMAIHRKLDPWGEDGVNIANPPISHPPAENYTTFNARNTYASAIVDWGKDQEVMGDGLFAIPEEVLGYDVVIRFWENTIPDLDKITFEVSRDMNEWALVPREDISTAMVSVAAGDDDLLIDIDPILSKNHWAYFRYMRINVTDGGYYRIKGGYAPILYRPMDMATSVTIGSLDLDYYRAFASGESEGKKIVLGTADGKIVMFEYNPATKGYDFLWNSYTNDSYTFATNIWDIVEVKSPGKIPTWQFNESYSPILNVNDQIAQLEADQSLPPGTYGEFYSVDHVSLFSAFFEAIFNEVPAFSSFKDIIELKIPRNDMVVGTTNGKLVVFPELTHQYSELANFFFQVVNADPFYNGMSLTPTFIDLNSDQDYFPEVMLLGWGRPDMMYNPEAIEGTTVWAGMDVYTYDPLAGPLGVYTGKFELQQVELTGLLARALEKSRNIPDAAVGDVDGDGDQDIVLTNGRIYFIENIENSLFILDSSYFQDLNLQSTDKLYTSPQLYDFDQDGDLDLTVSFSNRPGSTYFENRGTKWAPNWVENKWLYTNSWGGLRYNNLTSSALALDKNGRIEHLTAYNQWTGEIYQLEAEYDNHNAYVIGTNPIIARLEMNLKSGTDTHGNEIANYGYHVFKSWDSEAELARWTMTIKTGDTDQDGRNEIIIGDYDSNMYVFEHLTNNTYKRAYRSQDVTHKELSYFSPYAYQQLEGISGTFYRTVWDHIEELVVNLDMDGDGFTEIVGTAGLSIFVWEQRNDGFVSVDDEYTLIWQADLRQSAWAPLFQQLGISQFTASAWGGDLDYNGLGEFILAAGSFLFVFESNGADQFNDNFLVDPYPVRGRYFIPGNPLTSPAVRTLSIESIAVGDTDNDTLNEIIIGGVNKTWWGQYNGFVGILENQIGTYNFTWWAPSRLMKDNPVYDVLIDNQDLDPFKEIIVGTFKGIVIYENARNPNSFKGKNRNNFYYERSILTSYVNFPYIHLKQMFDVETKVNLALRNTDFIEFQKDFDSDYYPMGTWLQIFKAGNFLYFATSNNYGDTWTQHLRVTTTSLEVRKDFVSAAPVSIPMSFSEYEYHPSLYQTKDGRIWLAITAKLQFSASYVYEGIWLLELKTDGSGKLWWENALHEAVSEDRNVAISGVNHFLFNPSVWDFYNNTNFGVAISYINNTDGGIYWNGSFGLGTTNYGGRIPNIGYSSYSNNQTWGRTGYQAFAHDTIRSASGRVIVVFSGRKFDEGKVDLDLWIARSNSTPMWDEVFPYSRATIDGIDELHPSITQTVTPDHALMVIFEADGFKPSGALQVTYSKDDGNTWRDPEPITTTPPFAKYVVVPGFGFSLLVLKSDPSIIVTSLLSVGPAITAHWEGGFAYSFMAEYNLFAPFSYARVTEGSKVSINAYTSGSGYSASFAPVFQALSAGDISSHSGLVENIGGGLTTGGGSLSYQGEQIGAFVNITSGGGGSAIYYSPSLSKPQVTYTTPIVTQEEGFTAYGGNLLSYADDATGNDDPSSDPDQGTGYSDEYHVGLTTARFGGQSFHQDRKKPGRGYYNNIFFGMNPSSNFTLFDFKEARAISVGDSDKDYRREIAIASGSQAYLVEVSRTGGTIGDDANHVQFYYQSWHSDSLASPTTDIEFFDANSNGMDEIIVSCLYGNVYAFEGVNTNPPPTDYLYLDWDPTWRNTTAGLMSGMDNINPIPEKLMVKSDVDQDGLMDIISVIMDPLETIYNGFPVIAAHDGISGFQLWSFNLSSYLPRNSSIMYIETIDLNMDLTDDIVILANNFDSGNKVHVIAFVVNPTGLTERWETTIDFINFDEISNFEVHEVTGDINEDVLITIGDELFLVHGSDGTVESLYTFNSNEINIEHVSFGNNTVLISARKVDSDNGTVVYMSYNKTVLQEFIRNNSRNGLTAALLDINDDTREDIVIIESGLISVYDGVPINSSYPYVRNISLDKVIGNYETAMVYDFNGDSHDDLLVQLRLNIGKRFPFTTINFDDISNLVRIDDFYKDKGILFSNSDPNTTYMGWTSSSAYVPHSNPQTAFTYESDNYILIEDLASKVSAYFSTGTYGGTYIWEAYDYYGNLLDSESFLGDKPLQYVELNDPEGRIYRLHITGTLSGWESRWVMDDLAIYSGNFTKLIALSGTGLDKLWEYDLWETKADKISLADIDHDSVEDDLLFITEYKTGLSYTGAMTAIDGTYGTPFVNIQFEGSLATAIAGNFGDFHDIAIASYHGHVFMMSLVKEEPTLYQEVAIQNEASYSFKTRGSVVALEPGNFNGDTVDDIVFGDSKRYVIALDGLTGEMIWKYRTPSPVARLAVKDLNGDGFTDVAVALKSGLLYIINGETGRPSWKDYLGPVIFNDLQFFDRDNDGEFELAISMGFKFIATLGRIAVYNTTRDTVSGHGTIIWQKLNPFSPYTKLQIADFNNDGILDIAGMAYGQAIFFHNGINGNYFHLILTNVQDFAVGNFTGSPFPGIVIIMRNGTVKTYFGVSGWSSSFVDKQTNLVIPLRLSHLAVGDFDSDGLDEIVVRSLGDASYCLNEDLSLLWTFHDRSVFYLPKYGLADLNNDSSLDILTLNHDNIMALSGQYREPTQVIWASFVADYLIRSFTLGDFNDDDIIDVVIGTYDGWVYILHGKEEQLVYQQSDIESKIQVQGEEPLEIETVTTNNLKPRGLEKVFFILFLIVSGFYMIFSRPLDEIKDRSRR
ncbi:MAG: hypothetical protein ACTSPG_00460 [Candidatus Hodarchaeales archaeon]